MGDTTTTQNSSQHTEPWKATRPVLDSIVGGLKNINPGLSGNQSGALDNVGGRFDPATGRWDPVAEGPKAQAATQGQGVSVAGRGLAPGQASPMPPSNAPQFPNYGKLPQLWTAPAAPLG